MEQINFNPQQKQEHMEGEDIINLVQEKMPGLQDRFNALQDGQDLCIKGKIFLKSDTTKQINIEGVFSSVEELQSSIQEKLTQEDCGDCSVESISMEGYAQSSDGQEVEGTSFFRSSPL